MRTVALSEIAEQVRGVSYGKADVVDRPSDGYLPVLRANNITEEGLDLGDLVFVRSDKIGDRQKIRSGDIVIAASSGSISVVGKSAQALTDLEAGFGAFCKVVRPSGRVDHRYLGHYFRTPAYRQKMSAVAAGANINNLKNEHIDELEIPLPPLEEQKRIAAILDQADELRRKRQRALDRLNQLGQAIFIEMFGDPAINPMGWPEIPLGEMAEKFSDGPFGSNLKSEHYVERGIRVIRLQNIGVGEFLDNDRAYISEEHFRSLSKHACEPGDVLVGTMGDPNLRACLLPDHLALALNKADCVQIRPKDAVASRFFICGLLNHPSTERMAHDLILGQTRARISMGRLRGLRVPCPPLALQEAFGLRISKLEGLRAEYEEARASSEMLFTSLQHRAFRGELTASSLTEAAA